METATSSVRKPAPTAAINVTCRESGDLASCIRAVSVTVAT